MSSNHVRVFTSGSSEIPSRTFLEASNECLDRGQPFPILKPINLLLAFLGSMGSEDLMDGRFTTHREPRPTHDVSLDPYKKRQPRFEESRGHVTVNVSTRTRGGPHVS